MYQGAVLISTFAGEGCRFGQSGLNEGWKYVLGQAGLPAVHFVPSFFVDPATFGGLDVMNGAFNVCFPAIPCNWVLSPLEIVEFCLANGRL